MDIILSADFCSGNFFSRAKKNPDAVLKARDVIVRMVVIHFQDFEVEFANPKCSMCGSEEFVILPDAPFILEQIEFETE